jgi:hypothetical protein
MTKNNLTSFKAHLEMNSNITQNATDIKYRYKAGLNTYTKVEMVDKDGNVTYTYRRNLGDMNDLMAVITTGNLNANASVMKSEVWKEFVGDLD